MKIWIIVFTILSIFLLGGCHFTVPAVDVNVTPPPLIKKIPLNTAILITEQLENYTFTGPPRVESGLSSGATSTYPLGQLVKKSAQVVFPSFFEQAVLTKGEPYPADTDAVIIPAIKEFRPLIKKTSIYAAQISLKVLVIDKKGMTLWEGTVTSPEIIKKVKNILSVEDWTEAKATAVAEAVAAALTEAAMAMARSREVQNYVVSLGKAEAVASRPLPETAAKSYADEKPKKPLPPPTIEIIYPLDQSKTKLTEIELKIRIKSEGEIKRISITVNDQESTLNQNDLRRIEEPAAVGAIRGTRTWRPKVALAEGRNVVWVQALDQADNVAKAAVNIFREGKDTAQPLKVTTKVWLLAVGISKYKDSSLNLSFADKDARAFYQQLTHPEKGLISGGERAKLLLNEQATRINMVEALTHIFKQAFDEDLVILYFAMHGMVDPDGSELFFIASDTNPHSLAATGVSQLEIERAISKSKAGKVLMVVDTCHSGSAGLSGVFAQRAVSTAAVSSLLLNKIAIVKKGMSIFSASSSTEFSQENQTWGGGHGVFTHYLIEGLKGAADENKDKFITLRELYDYTYRRVKEDTKSNQHPEIKGTLDSNIPLAEVR